MPDVTVGVRRWATDHEVKPREKATSEVGVYWIKIGDVLLTAEDHQLMAVTYEADSGFGVVTLKFPSSGFKTVDHRRMPK